MLSDDAVKDGTCLTRKQPIHSGLEDIQTILIWKHARRQGVLLLSFEYYERRTKLTRATRWHINNMSMELSPALRVPMTEIGFYNSVEFYYSFILSLK